MKKILLSIAFTLSVFANPILATVNGEAVTYEDVALLLKAMPNVNYATLSQDQKDKVLDQVIDRKILQIEAKKSGIEKSREFKVALNKIKGDLALEVWMQKEFKKIKISTKESKEYYNKNKFRFTQKESVRARHILVKSSKEAKGIIKELNNANNLKDKFISLAKSKSTGPSGKNGGDLGFFDKTQMVKPFSDAAYNLKVGTITQQPVKTQFGYHIIFLEEKKAGGSVEFSKVEAQIKRNLAVERFNKQIVAKSKKLRKRAKVVKK